MSRKVRIIIIASCGVVVCGLTLAGYVVYRGLVGKMNAYAVWAAANVVISHMELHDGAWPQGWDDLRRVSEKVEKVARESDGCVSDVAFPAYGNLRRPVEIEVEIDWAAKPERLVRTEPKEKEPPFRVIWLRDGSTVHFAGKEPNQMILDYLKCKQRKTRE